MAKKYLVIGGMVTSKTDRQIHYVSSRTLVALYGVDVGRCLLIGERDRPDSIADDLIVLRPRPDGNYRLPSVADELTVVTRTGKR